jgi:hypothetical protein
MIYKQLNFWRFSEIPADQRTFYCIPEDFNKVGLFKTGVYMPQLRAVCSGELGCNCECRSLMVCAWKVRWVFLIPGPERKKMKFEARFDEVKKRQRFRKLPAINQTGGAAFN